MTFEEFREYMEPALWKYVYIRSIESVGFVSSSSQQSGHPERNTVTVTLLEENGSWRADGIKKTYSMDEAREDLVPNIRCLIEEEPI